jgi:phosphoglycerate dehydrogenase-like enzyme
MTRTLLVTPPLSADRRGWLERELGAHWQIEGAKDGLPIEQAHDIIPVANAVVGMRWPASVPSSPDLELIQLIGAGYDGIAFAAVPPRCTVCNVYEHEIGIAEYVVLAMLEHEIKLSRQDAGMREGRWVDGFATNRPLHGELYGKTVGFIGYGHIAKESAKRLKAFGVRTMACTRTVGRCDEWVDNASDLSGLNTVLEQSHYVVLTTPLTAQTRDLVDAAFLSSMRSDAVLINVARGAVVNEQALFDALSDKVIAGAVIDTWYHYPSPSNPEPVMPSSLPFQQLDNITMTPHSSGWSAGLLDRRWKVIVNNLKAMANGSPLENVLKAPGGKGPDD